MIIYLSGGGVRGVWQSVNVRLLERGAARLLSFAYSHLLIEYCKLAKEHYNGTRFKVMVDSGAFTAWTQGKRVPRAALAGLFARLLQSYSSTCDFVLINLDVIPGRKGIDPTPAELVEAQKQSEENFAHLSAQFPSLVLPVFHQGEPSTYYDTLTSHSEYVCLSPRNDLHEKVRVNWAQRYSQRNAKRRFHGLAATGITMMETVNWYSVDSATWIMVGGYGGILWRSLDRLWVLACSAESKQRKDWDSHVDNLPRIEKDHLLEEVHARGYTLEELRTNDRKRYSWNADQRIDLQLRKRHSFQEVIFDG